EPRIGRGLFEPLNAAHPMLMQVWYEENETLREALTASGIEPVPQERMLDPTDRRYEVAPLEDFVDVVEEDVEAAPVVEDLDLDLGEVDLGSLLAGDAQDDPPEQDKPEGAADIGEEPDSAPVPPQAAQETELSPPARRLALSELGEVTWELIEALTVRLATGDISEVVPDLDGLDGESEVGATYRELIADMTSDAGVRLRTSDLLPAEPVESDTDDDAATDGDGPDMLEAEPDLAVEDVEPDRAGEDAGAESPAPGTDPDGDEDGFDFGFQAPPMVRGGL